MDISDPRPICSPTRRERRATPLTGRVALAPTMVGSMEVRHWTVLLTQRIPNRHDMGYYQLVRDRGLENEVSMANAIEKRPPYSKTIPPVQRSPECWQV